MASPTTLLPFPPGTPPEVAQWLNALIFSVAVPVSVAWATTWLATAQARKQFNSTTLTAKQQAAAWIIDSYSDFGRKIDGQLRSSDTEVMASLADLRLPEARDQAALLGPKVAMALQHLKDTFAEANDEISEVHRRWNEATVAGEPAEKRTATRLISVSICRVLLANYSLVGAAAQSAKLPYTPRWRVGEAALKQRLATEIRLAPYQSAPPREAASPPPS